MLCLTRHRQQHGKGRTPAQSGWRREFAGLLRHDALHLRADLGDPPCGRADHSRRECFPRQRIGPDLAEVSG